MSTLISPGVSVSVTTGGVYSAPSPTTIPLVILATRANKLTPDGTATAPGTIESNQLRLLTSQRDVLQNYGNPVFVTSSGTPVPGDETNEYGLFALYSFLGIGNSAYVLRANIDLGQLVPTTVTPTLPPPNATYWIQTNNVVGGVFQYNGTTWVAQTFHVFLTNPTSANGNNGDWAFNYATLDGVLMFKSGGAWYTSSTSNITSYTSSTHAIHVQPTAPTGPSNFDFWFKNTPLAGGENLSLVEYQASTGTWIAQTIVNTTNGAPTPTAGTIWEDDSQITINGNRQLYLGTGATFIPLEFYVQATAPYAEPTTGTLWFDDTITDFAMAYNPNNLWVPILTTTVINPSATQKYISVTAPTQPSVGAIWVDISTQLNLDNWPVIKQWTGSAWNNITSTVVITDSPLNPVTEGANTYWINTGDPITRNIVKKYNPSYTAYSVNPSTGQPNAVTGWNWAPDTGTTFGRQSQRLEVVTALQATVSSNDLIRSEDIYYQLITAPGYVELYEDLVNLNSDNNQVSFCIQDTPKFMIPSGIPTGREITAQAWSQNSNNVVSTGEQGFSAAGDPYSAFYYPWCLATNVDGNNVFTAPSHMILRTIAYSDSVSAPWFPPAGYNRGMVDNAQSVGYLSDNNVYTPLLLNKGQRDTLYTYNINPIANIPTKGITVMGQKTMDPNTDALNRVNVVRLIAKMHYDLNQLFQPFLFEINDALTRQAVTVVAERYLSGLMSNRALYDYAVICDSTNNTPTTIDANQLIIEIGIQPAKAIEFIYVPITIYGTGDTIPT